MPPGRDATLDSVRWPTDRLTIYREWRIGFPLLPGLPDGTVIIGETPCPAQASS